MDFVFTSVWTLSIMASHFKQTVLTTPIIDQTNHLSVFSGNTDLTRMSLSRKFPFIRLFSGADCLMCAFRPMTIMTGILGCECPHSNENAERARMYTTKLRARIFFMGTLPIIFAWWNTFLYKITSLEDLTENLIENVITFSAQTWNILILLSIAKNHKSYIEWTNGLNDFFITKNAHGIPILLSEKKVKRIQFITIGAYVFIVLLVITQVVVSLRLFGNGYFQLINIFTMSLTYMNAVYLTFHLLLWQRTYYIVFTKLLELLQQNFENRLRFRHLALPPDNSFCVIMRSCLKYYGAYILSYENHILSFTMIFYDIYHFVVVIGAGAYAFLYVTYIVFNGSVKMDVAPSIGCLQDFALLAVAAVVVFVVEKILNVSEKFLSYLHKFPLSSLTEEERNVVENMLRIVAEYRPLLSAGEILFLRKTFITATLGHIIVYILMALQFDIFSYF